MALKFKPDTTIEIKPCTDEDMARSTISVDVTYNDLADIGKRVLEQVFDRELTLAEIHKVQRGETI